MWPVAQRGQQARPANGRDVYVGAIVLLRLRRRIGCTARASLLPARGSAACAQRVGLFCRRAQRARAG